jgi:hypothetical protein
MLIWLTFPVRKNFRRLLLRSVTHPALGKQLIKMTCWTTCRPKNGFKQKQPAYMSLEQARADNDVREASDIHVLGVIEYQIGLRSGIAESGG